MLSKIKVTDGEGDIRGDGNNDAMNSTGKLEHRRGPKGAMREYLKITVNGGVS